jgi:hypothetical protein
MKLNRITEVRIDLMNMQMKIELLDQRIKMIRNIIIVDIIILLIAIILTK